MKIFRAVILLCIIFIISYCSEKKNNPASDKSEANKPGFTITGTTSGFYDSTWIFIESAGPESISKPLDSAMVLDGHFALTGRIKVDAMPAMLRTKNFSDYVFMWLENKPISFKGTKGSFNTAKISGSEMQLESSRLDSVIAPIKAGQDSVNLALIEDKADKNALAGRLQTLNEKEKQTYISFIQNNPNSLISAYLLSVHQKTWGKATTTQLYNTLSEANKNSSFGKAVAD